MGKIYCSGCDTYLGNIEGKIKKGISYLCPSCEQQRVTLEIKYREKYDLPEGFEDLFKGFL